MFFNSENKNNILCILHLCSKMSRCLDEMEIESSKKRLIEKDEFSVIEDLSSKIDRVLEILEKVEEMDKKISAIYSWIELLVKETKKYEENRKKTTKIVKR